MDTITVTIRDRSAEAAWGSGPTSPVIRTVEIAANCPTCGAPRGQRHGLNTCEDGAYYWVETWTNPCGHLDTYEAVMREARALAEAEEGCTWDMSDPSHGPMDCGDDREPGSPYCSAHRVQDQRMQAASDDMDRLGAR